MSQQGEQKTAATKGQAEAVRAIQLHVDLEVDQEKEQSLVFNFHTTFMPAMSRQPGFVEVKLMKLRKAMKGNVAGNATHRLLISFRTEEDRLAWVATDAHQKVWPTIAGNLKGGTTVSAMLYDVI